MEVSKLEISEKISNKPINRNDKRKLRLEKVKELYGDSYVTSKEFCSAAGFDMNVTGSKEYKKGMNFIQALKKIGAISDIPSGEVNDYGKPVTLYRLKFIPDGKVTQKAKSTIKRFTKDDIKKLSNECKTEEIVEKVQEKEIKITITSEGKSITALFPESCAELIINKLGL